MCIAAIGFNEFVLSIINLHGARKFNTIESKKIADHRKPGENVTPLNQAEIKKIFKRNLEPYVKTVLSRFRPIKQIMVRTTVCSVSKVL